MTPQKLIIIKEFDKILKNIARGNPHYAKLIEPRLRLAIQNTMKELKRKSFYAEVSIPVDSGSPIKYRKLSVEWSDVIKHFGKVE